MTISEQVARLEQENERLQAMVDVMGEELETTKKTIAKQDRFIDLVGPSVTRLEALYDRVTHDYCEIVDAFRVIRPKETSPEREG